MSGENKAVTQGTQEERAQVMVNLIVSKVVRPQDLADLCLRFIKSRDDEVELARNQTKEQLIEKVAEAIYNQFSYTENGVKPLWVMNGNSLKQEEARSIARATLYA